MHDLRLLFIQNMFSWQHVVLHFTFTALNKKNEENPGWVNTYFWFISLEIRCLPYFLYREVVTVVNDLVFF